MTDFKKGDYVLATRWQDGDCFDPWYIGFYSHYDANRDRHYIVDDAGGDPYPPGFRRVQKISSRRGNFILDHYDKGHIAHFRKSLLWWSRVPMKSYETHFKPLVIPIRKGDGQFTFEAFPEWTQITLPTDEYASVQVKHEHIEQLRQWLNHQANPSKRLK